MNNPLNKSLFLALFFSFLFIVTGCSSDEPEMPSQETTADRTILVYIAANNSLGTLGNDKKDIEEMKIAVMSGALGNNNRLLVFHASTDGDRKLYKATPSGLFEVIKEYEDGTNSVESNFMLQVFTDAKEMSPSHDYGLIMWSHSMGWTQNGTTDDGPELTPKTWGQDGSSTMNITTLKRVLEASPWSWIYFDCCFMGSVEVAYELSPVLKKMVASATEVPLDGMPYDKNLALLFQPEADLVGAARNTFDYYNAKSGEARTVSISVLDLNMMRELGDATSSIYKKSVTVSPTAFYNLPLEVAAAPKFYDFGVYVKGLCDVNDLEDMYPAWEGVYKSAILYEAATPYLWNQIDLAAFTGMSTFIPRTQSELTLRGYDTLTWYENVAKYLYYKE